MTFRITLTKVTKSGCKTIERWLSDSVMDELTDECRNHLVGRNKNYETTVCDYSEDRVIRMHINESENYKFIISEHDDHAEFYASNF